jgi:hypothetical protein
LDLVGQGHEGIIDGALRRAGLISTGLISKCAVGEGKS